MVGELVKKLISNKKYFVMIIVLFVLLSLTIGSALLSSSLSITGTSLINKNRWVIYFDGIHVPSDSVEASEGAHIVDAAKTRIDFTVDLRKPGDFYEFTVDTVNDGTIDAYIDEITKTELTEEQQEYLDFYVEYYDLDVEEVQADPSIKIIRRCDILGSGKRRKIIAYVGFKDGIDLSKYPTTDLRLNLSFSIKYVQTASCDPIKPQSQCKLIINPNEGLYEGRMEPRYIYFDPGSTYVVSIPTRKYHNFLGWTADKAEGTGLYTFDQTNFTIVSCDADKTEEERTVTITADWREGDYVARIMDTYYETIQLAFDAASGNWEDNTVWLIKDTTENATNKTSTPFAFNLDGHTVTGQITNNTNGDITLLNGRIETTAEQDSAFINYGKLTMGEDDGYVDVDNSIALVGNEEGLLVMPNSEFHFYDGYLEGMSGITGIGKNNLKVTEKAAHHYVFYDYITANSHQKVYLIKNPNRAVAKTYTGGESFFHSLQGAIQVVEREKEASQIHEMMTPYGDDDYVIYFIRDFEAAYDLSVQSGSRIFIETEGYQVNTGKSFTNNGYLNIHNSKTNKSVIRPSQTITNNGTLNIDNIRITATANTTALKNKGTLNLNAVRVEGNSAYGVSNEGSGRLNIDSLTVLTATGSYGLNNTASGLVLTTGTIYGLNNNATMEVNGDVVIHKNGDIPGINNNNGGRLTLTEGTVDSVTNSATFIQNGGLVHYVSNTSSYTQNGGELIANGSSLAVYNDGTYTLNDGTIRGQGQLFDSYRSYSGTLNINGGLIESASGTAMYIGTINMNDGTIHMENGAAAGGGSNTFNMNGGLVYTDNGTAITTRTTNVRGGEIRATEYGVSSSNFTMTNGTINSTKYGVDGSTSSVSGGTINSRLTGLSSSGLTMSGGTITSSEGSGIVLSGTSTITGGNVYADIYGVHSKGTLTIGSNDGTISSTSPMFQGNSYGLYIEGSTTNFYDGIVKGAVDGYTGRITGTPLGATIGESTEEIDGITYKTEFIVDYEGWLQIGTEIYNSINAASDACPDNEECTITVIKDPETTFVQSFNGSNKNIVFDLNGHTIHSTQTINNNSTVRIIDSSAEQTGLFEVTRPVPITNWGSLTIDAGTYKSTNDTYVITNRKNATMVINNGTFTGNYTAIESRSSITINNGTFTGKSGIKNYIYEDGYTYGGSITMNNGTITATNYGIELGYITLNGGTITSSNVGVSGGATVNNGTITSINEGISNGATINGGLVHARDGVAVNGNYITVTGGEVISDNNYGLYANDDIYVSGGKITGTVGVTHRYWCDVWGDCWYEPITVTGGEIIGTTSHGLAGRGSSITITGGLIRGEVDGVNLIYDNRASNPTVGTIGSNDGTISTSVPEIRGKRYGLYTSAPNANFFDGILEGQQKAHEGLITMIPDATMINDDYVYINRELYQTQYIVAFGDWLRVRDREFSSLHDAYNYANDEDFIYVIRDAYVNFAQSLGEGKNIVLDLQGHEVIMTQTLNLSGAKMIRDATGEGAIHNLRTNVISSSGTLIIDGGNYSTDSGTVITSSGTLTIENGELTGTNGISTGGTCNINGGRVIGRNQGISNTGNLTIDGGYVEGRNSNTISSNNKLLVKSGEIYNTSTTALSVRNNTTIEGGSIKSDGGLGVYQCPGRYEWGTINISGGTIEGRTDGISICGYDSVLNTTGGTIKGVNGRGVTENITSGNMRLKSGEFYGGQYGVYTSSNTHLGEDDRRIAIDAPLLQGDLYGLYIAGGTLNFYDGILKGITSQVYGQITNIPEFAQEYDSYEEINSVRYETKYLITEQVIAINLNQFDDEGHNIEYTNFQRALDEGREGDTIQLIEDVPLYYVVTNTNSNAFTLDLNGHTVTTNKPMTTNGRLTIINSNTEKDGIIKTSSSMVLLTNTNELNLNNVKFVNTSSSNYVLRNTGRLTAENIKVDAIYGVQTSGMATINNSTINGRTTALDNSGSLSIDGGTYTGSSYSIYTNASNKTSTINNVRLNGNFYTASGTTNMDTIYFNGNYTSASGNVTVNNGTFPFTTDHDSPRTISNGANTTISNSTISNNGYISNSGTLHLVGDTINTYYASYRCYNSMYHGMTNSGTLELNNTNYRFDANTGSCANSMTGIYTTGNLTIHEDSIVTVGSTSRTDKPYYGIYADGNSKTRIIDENGNKDEDNPTYKTIFTTLGGNIAYSLFANSAGSSITVETGRVEAINTPQAYAGYANNGKIIMGVEDEGESQVEMSHKHPILYAVGSTRGIGVKKINGEFHFFDGVIWASRYAKPETTTKVQRLYEVTTYVDNETGYEYAWLEYMPENYQGQTTALLNGIYYTTLQDAINAYDAYAYTGEHIKLLKSITEDIHVDSGSSAIINLNGHSVTGQVINYGTLQIYDGSLQNFEHEAVINGGKLIIGKDDGVVSSTSVRIVSEVMAINNLGEVEFYDGYLEGNPTLENDFSKIAEFARVYTVNEAQYQRKYLQSLSEESIRNKETDLMLTVDANDGYYYYGLDMHGEEIWKKDAKVIWLKYEDTYQLLEPQKHGCYFKGWEATDEVIDDQMLVTMGLKDVVVTAKWQVREDVVAKIGNEYYFTLEEALAATQPKDVIELLADVEENVHVGSNKEITLDMHGHIIQGAFINDGILTLLDGVIENTDGIGLINNKTVTMGINDGEIEIGKVQVIGTTLGMEQNGNFNFYDGFIEGDVAMNGTTNSVPRGYFLYTEHNNIKDCQRTYLIGNPENAVAIISDVTTQYFFNLRDAIEAAHVSGKEIYIVKDFEAAYPVDIKEGYDIVINMNSYNITTGNLITNNGTLRIYDDSEVKGSINSARSIVNYGTMTIEDIQLKQNKSVDTIDNQGTLTVKNATVNATDHAGISNKANASLTVEDSLVTSNSGYAVHNDAGGNITLTGDYELTVTTGYGLDNYGTITNTLNSGHIVGIFSNTGFTTEDGLLVTNSTNKPAMSLRAATYNFNGGTFTATNDNTVYTEGGNITYNINGGTFTSTTHTGFYVASGTKSNFNITGGTITAKSHGIDHRGDNGTLILDNANIHADDTGIRVVNSNSKLTLNSGDVYGGLYGIYFNAAKTIFTMTGGNVTGYTYDGFRDDYSSDSMTYNITGGHIKGGRYGIHKYNDYLVVENATIETTSNNRDHYALHTSWGSVRLKSGARIIAERASGIWAEDALTMDEGSYIYAGAYNAYGIAERWMNSFNMNGGTIETPGPSALGFYSYEDVLVFNMNGGTINSGNVGLSLTAGNNVTRSVNIYGGSIIGKTYGVQQTNSYYNTIIGKESDELSTEVPYISGGLYGYYKTAGTFKFFGGRLRGKTFGYSGTYNLIRHAKEITTYVEDVEGVEDILTYSTTSTSATATANTAKSGNGYARLTYLGETTDLCEYNQTYTYDYTGQEEIFIIPCAGKYSLEVWGAQGGYGIQDGNKNAGTPGYGGYAYGEIDFDVNETLFINVGGKGENGSLTSCAAGGYNGGGRGTNDGGECINPYDDDASGGGGGATHIATSSGLLSDLANNKSSVIIVAGGGGGASYNKTGGSGGGYIGGIANNGNTIYQSGTQTSGYAFGRGKDGEGLRQNGTCGLDTPSCVGVAGGGAGYYGGLNTDNDVNSSGTGGSGYIANERITNGVMYGYNVEATVGTWYNNYLIDKEAFLQVGTETFNTFEDASAAIEENGTGRIIVLKDTEIMDTPTIVGNRTITLDLNGHVITNRYINIVNEANLTIIDSSDEKTGEIKALVSRAIENKGNLTLNGVKLSGLESGSSTIYGSSGNGTITIKDSTITGVHNTVICDSAQTVVIENSTLTATTNGVQMNKPGSRVEMKSGTITAQKYGIYLSGATSSNILIEGGEINSTDTAIYMLNSGSTSVTYETGTINSGVHGICFDKSANSIINYKDGEITAGNVGIYFATSGTSTLNYKDGEITASNVGIYANSSGNVTLNYTTGTITSENIGIDYNESGSSNIHIYDISINAKNQGLYNHSASNIWTIDTASVTSREGIAIDFATYNSNRNTLTITDGTYTAATHGVVVHSTNATINGGTFTTTSTNKDHYMFHVESDSSLTLSEGTTVTAGDASGIYTSCGLTINNVNIESNNTSGYGINHQGGNLSITNSSITAANGIYSPSNNNSTINYTDSTIDSSNIGIYVSGTGTKTLNINTGTISGDISGLLLNGNNTTTNLGVKDDPLSIQDPHIISDNTAVNNNFGKFNFYSGLLTGGSKVLNNEASQIREGKEVNYEYSTVDGITTTLTSFNHSQSAKADHGKQGNGYAKLTLLELNEDQTIDETEAIEDSTKCNVPVGTMYDFEYTGELQEFVAQCSGDYKLEVWGAQGGYRSDSSKGGRGGYSVGTLTMDDNDKLIVKVGASGNNGGYNGGGTRVLSQYGGGATDIRVYDSLYARIIVAGGGGSDGASGYGGAYGGGTQGGDASGGCGSGGLGGTQTGVRDYRASFGQGGRGENWSSGYGGAGGGGWYGGGGADPDRSVDDDRGGGGGSGYVFTASTLSSYPADRMIGEKYFLKDAKTIAGNTAFPSPTLSMETGHPGNGYARITLLSVTNDIVNNTTATVNLNPGIGTISNNQLIYNVGDVLGELPDPIVSSDYTFKGWYIDSGFSKKVTSETVVKHPANLYARYEYNHSLCDNNVNATYSFDYTGQVEGFYVPCAGKYKMEVWGASGGLYGSNTNIGYGGYSVGYIDFRRNEKIYIAVGEQGKAYKTTNNFEGTFNGGGLRHEYIKTSTSGGGATHIATSYGVLSNLESNKESILIVAGGGGASGATGIGGSGGGFIGGDGIDSSNNAGSQGYNGTGANQNSGGITYNNTGCLPGTFGNGSSVCDFTNGGSGGGGGYYGGGASSRNHAGGGGGSGFINESRLTNAHMYGYNVPTDSTGLINAYLSTIEGFLEVNGNTYNNFEQAINAIQDTEGTITVLNHSYIHDEVTFPADKTIVLDLNGYELNFEKSIINNSNLSIVNTNPNLKGALVNSTTDVIMTNENLTIDNVAIKSGASLNCIKANGPDKNIVIRNNSSLSGEYAIYSNEKENISISDSEISTGSTSFRFTKTANVLNITNCIMNTTGIVFELPTANNIVVIDSTYINNRSNVGNSTSSGNSITIRNSDIISDATFLNITGSSNVIDLDNNTIEAKTGISSTGNNLELTLHDNSKFKTYNTVISTTGNNVVSTISSSNIESINSVGINHRGTSNTMNVYDCNIIAKSNGIYHTGNNSELTVLRGSVTSTQATGVIDDASSTVSTKPIVNLTNTTITGANNGVYMYYCDSFVEDSEIISTSSNKDHFVYQSLDNSVATIHNTVLRAANASGAKCHGNYVITDSQIKVDGVHSYGIYGNSTNITFTNSSIEATGAYSYGIYAANNDSNSIITLNNSSIVTHNVGIGLYNSYNRTKNLVINGGIVKGDMYGIYEEQPHNTTIGLAENENNTSIPLIYGGLYGLYKTTGEVTFNSGKLKGTTGAYYGIINNIREQYEIFEDREEMEEELLRSRTYSTTEVSSDAISNMPKLGNGYARITFNSYNNVNNSISSTNVEQIGYDDLQQCQSLVGTVYDFSYTGTLQEFNAKCAGEYKLEVWGGQGGYRSNESAGGRGGYSVGTISLTNNEKLYVKVGASGNNGGYNGGGTRVLASYGGGATDIRKYDNLYARIIVAGGGGSDGASSYAGAYGGGTQGGDASGGCGSGGLGGTQTGVRDYRASFGQGGRGENWSSGYGGAGGGGWYGGGGANPDRSVDDDRGGGGGSGYVYTSSTARNYPSGCLLNERYYLTNAQLIAGNQTIYEPNGLTSTGHRGDGYARITLLSLNVDENGAQTVSIEYDSGIGSLDNNIIDYLSGYAIGEMPEPTAPEGYTFEGWYTDRYYRNKVTEETIIYAGTTLYAKYTAQNEICNTSFVYDYNYTSKEQFFNPPCSGTYTLEVWGAQGGGNAPNSTSANRAGAGGYARAKIDLTNDELLYINVGGKGITGNHVIGGYNGGGYSGTFGSYGSGSGGGATHIATKSGLLASLDSDRDKVLIVAGGGGGSDDIGNGTYNSTDDGSGGSGGGFVGGYPTIAGASATQVIPGEQERGFAFGKGQDGYTGSDTGGAGAGWYGGYSSLAANGGGSGGSGYVGNSRLTDTYMYSYKARHYYDSDDFKVAYLVEATEKIKNVEQDKTYTNVQDAFDEVNDTETLELIKDTSISYDVTVPNKQVILDLNGFNFVTNKSIINNGDLTITDSTNTQNISMSSSINSTLISNNNTLNITGSTIEGYNIVSSADGSNISLSNATLTGNSLITIGIDGSLTINNSDLNGVNDIVTGVGTTVNIISSTITSSSQAINTAGELSITNSTITGNTYGVYTNTSSNVIISNSTITAGTAIYNNNVGTITVGTNSEIRGAVNNSKADGTFNMTGGLLNGSLGNTGKATLTTVNMTYTYDTSGNYSYINNSGILTLGSVRVDIRNNNGSSNSNTDRVIYNSGTLNSNTNTYLYTGGSNSSRVVRGIENAGILHSTNDTFELRNRPTIRAIENNSNSTVDVTNITATIVSSSKGIGLYNVKGNIEATGGSISVQGDYAYGMEVGSSGYVISTNTNYTMTGGTSGRIGHSEGGTVTFAGGTGNISGQTNYCLDSNAGGTVAMTDGTCNNTATSKGDGLQTSRGVIIMEGGTINITSSNVAHGIQLTEGTADIKAGTLIVNGKESYGVHMTNGTMTIGVEDGSGTQQADMQVDNPHIEAIGTTTGIGSTMGNGTFNYYDGTIIGSTRARAQGDITSAVEKNYQVVTRTDEVTGYEYCILEFIM